MARKEHDYHYIYTTTCSITGRYYIGMHSTSNLEDGYIGSGTRLWKSLNKHGKNSHSIEILEWYSDRNSLKLREKELVNEEILNDPMCMNLIIGGGGGKISDEQQRSRSIAGGLAFANKLKSDPKLLKQVQMIASNNLKKLHEKGTFNYNTFQGKTHSEETKNKIGKANSIRQSGYNNSQYGTCWITNEIDSKKIHKGDLIPDGWRLGRKSPSK